MPRNPATLPYRRAPDLDGFPTDAPVAVVGAGPVGLALAIDLAQRGVACVVLDDNDVVATGSRAIGWAKRSLDILDRLGVGQRVLDKGVPWQVSRVFHGARELYSTDLLPEPGQRMPAFLNLQQYHLEDYLIDRCTDFPDLIDLRFRNCVTGVEPRDDGVTVQVYTEDGRYAFEAQWCVACDGARSAVRGMLGLDFEGRAVVDRFLVADFEMQADLPADRLFWFEPPFHPGQTALLQRQPDNLFRLDLQLGPDADPEAERRPEAVLPRIEAAVGGRPVRLDWVSVYGFQCRRLARFLHGRVIFAGDAAHVVPPFGARGGNGGLQDIDNLGWKLAAVVRGEAPARLLDSYDAERTWAADENIAQAARAADFMVPATPGARALRDEVLAMAATEPFARRLVNPGRLSAPSSLAGFPLQTPDDPAMAAALGAAIQPGTPCVDAPAGDGWLLHRLGAGFVLLAVDAEPPAGLPDMTVVRVGEGGVPDTQGLVRQRYGQGLYLVRPDQHVAARWASPEAAAVAGALDRAMAREG